MEFDKEEARRALDIAERKLSENDYVGAKKFVKKAQNLYPMLDVLKQVSMMIDVYVSASDKINGEADWYGILGVDPLADDEAVKKQYKKLALLLHPDKNKCKGAEGAFKLVLEAWCLLSDKAKRSDYDQKRKSKAAETRMQKPPNPHKPASNNGNRNARDSVDPSAGDRSNKPASGTQKPPNPHKPASSNGNQNERNSVDPSAKARSNNPAPAPAPANSSKQRKGSSFWTMCNRCRTQCEYVREYYLNKAILCPNCGQTYIATEKTPWASFVKPVNLSSSSPQQQRSAQKKATNKNTNGASSSGRNSTPSARATQKTPQANAKRQATNRSTNGASSSPSVSTTGKSPQASAQNQATNNNTNGTSSGKVSSPSVNATRRTPEASFVRLVVNHSSSSQQQQQWSTQNQSTSQNTSGGISFSFHWNCSASVKVSSNSRNAANPAQESSKRVLEESQETLAAAERLLKKPRTDVR